MHDKTTHVIISFLAVYSRALKQEQMEKYLKTYTARLQPGGLGSVLFQATPPCPIRRSSTYQGPRPQPA